MKQVTIPLASKLAVVMALALASSACRGDQNSTVTPEHATGDPVQTADMDADANLTAILLASDLPPTNDAPLENDPMQVTVHRLSNGMTVYISTDRQKPRFSAWIAVRAGSRMDPADSTGLAHYLEHMLFKGSDDFGTLDAKAEAPHVEAVRELYGQLRQTDDAAKRAEIFAQIDAHTQKMAEVAVPNEFDRMYSELGVAGLNAFTNDESTVYIGDVPTNRLEAWATVESERFADPVFRLFYPELEAVYEEKNLSLDRPYSRVWEAMMLGLYPQHPYGTQTTIGTVEHLKNPAYDDMVAFFERWYVPNNMAIILSGDIDADTALPVLEAKFSRLQPKPLEKPAPGQIKPLAGRVTKQVKADGEEAVNLAWLTVPVGHPDEPALAVLDRLLDDSRVGLLNTELELTQKVPEAGSWHSAMTESGYFGVSATARAGQTPEELEGLLLGVVTKLKQGQFTDADVKAVALQEIVRQTQQRETPSYRNYRIASAFVEHQPWADVVARDQAFQKVTRDDVVRVANKYLGKDYLALAKVKGEVEIPKLDKPKITPVKIDPSRRSTFADTVLHMEAPELTPQWVVEGEHYTRHRLPAGELIAAANDRNGLFTVNYRFKRGFRKDPLLCHALELFELSGAGDRSAEQVQKQLYALGSSVDAHCDDDYSWISVSGLDANLEPTMAILDGWISNPSFEPDASEKLYKNTISKRKDSLELDWMLTSALSDYAQFGRRSMWLHEPSNVELQRAKPAQLKALVAGLFGREHLTMYFGPRTGEQISAVVSRGNKHKPAGEVQPRVYRKAKSTQVYFIHKDGAKANIRFVIPRKPLPRGERPAAKLLSEYLSGNMSALVFQEIREARGLAYSAYARYTWGDQPKDASGLLGFMSTQADKTPEAVSTFVKLLETDDIQGPRLAQAQASLDQEYRATRIDPRWVTGAVAQWDDLGESTDPRPWEWEQVKLIDAAGLKHFASQFVGAPVIIAVIGDRERVDLKALKAVGEVHEVKLEDIVSYGAFPEWVETPKATTEQP